MNLVLHRACRCGHDKDTHTHYRRGTDCSGCDCVSYQGRFSLTVRVRTRCPVDVVIPDMIHAAPQPYVRPTHAAGVGGRADPSLARLLARPRRSDEPTAPAKVRTPH